MIWLFKTNPEKKGRRYLDRSERKRKARFHPKRTYNL
jgi:hypothetical protein